MQSRSPILTKPINELPVSEELVRFMIFHGYENLQELIKEKTSKLQRSKGWNVMCFESLLNILDKHNCLDMLSED